MPKPYPLPLTDLEDPAQSLRESHIEQDFVGELQRLKYTVRKDITDPAAFSGVFDTEPVIDLPYWTEAALMSAAGINTVVYGPGNLEQAHRPDEYVELDQLAAAQERYAAVLAGALS